MNPNDSQVTAVNPDLGSKATEINPHLAGNVTVVNAELASTRGLRQGDTILNEYKIYKRLAVESGEADLYLCQRDADSEQYIAKVYRREDSIKPEVIAAIGYLNTPYVSKIYASGEVDGRSVIILPYYKNGSLAGKRFSYEELREHLIPCLNEALKELHSIGIIHKDLKPSNIMMRDDGTSYAIIDFGISSVTRDGNTVLVTRTGMTPEYSAPETFRSVFLEESDYYSLGITLYELFTGYTPYHNMTPEQITQYMSLQRIPFPEDMPKALCDLITGLTYNDLTNRNDEDNPNRRWTYSEVQDWCEGKEQIIPGEARGEADAGTTRTDDNRKANAIPEYRFNGVGYHDKNKLIHALAADWNNGKKQLYRGILSGFFMACDQEAANICMNAMDRAQLSKKEEDFEFWKVIYAISPSTTAFYWKDHQEATLAALAGTLLKELREENFTDSLFDAIPNYKLISQYMAQHGYSETAVTAANALEKSIVFSQKASNVWQYHFYTLCYLLADKRDFVIDGQSVTTLDDLVGYLKYVGKNSIEQYKALCPRLIDENQELNPQLEAWLIAIGEQDKVNAWRKK